MLYSDSRARLRKEPSQWEHLGLEYHDVKERAWPRMFQEGHSNSYRLCYVVEAVIPTSAAERLEWVGSEVDKHCQ